MMSGRGHLILLLCGVFAGSPALAAEIGTTDGRIKLTYDDTAWTGAQDNAGLPELACKAGGCGGNTAGCGTVLVDYDGEALSQDSFENGFKDNLGQSAVTSADANGGSNAEIVEAAAVATHGANRGVGLSLRVTFDDQPTRVDHFWLQAGPDLVGITCLVADDRYEAAKPAFERIFADAAVANTSPAP
jgi:hypothetical protein